MGANLLRTFDVPRNNLIIPKCVNARLSQSIYCIFVYKRSCEARCGLVGKKFVICRSRPISYTLSHGGLCRKSRHSLGKMNRGRGGGLIFLHKPLCSVLIYAQCYKQLIKMAYNMNIYNIASRIKCTILRRSNMRNKDTICRPMM